VYWEICEGSEKNGSGIAIRGRIFFPQKTMTTNTKQAKGERLPVTPGRRLRHRVVVAGKVVFGPGKADVLEGIRETGSLAATARSMGMSYMKAWRLVREMRQLYAEPLVEMRRGGKAKGGATLTAGGERALSLYRQMEREALEATEPAWRKFRGLLDSSHRGEETGK
jgi:molybdate transport system regulatory protein